MNTRAQPAEDKGNFAADVAAIVVEYAAAKVDLADGQNIAINHAVLEGSRGDLAAIFMDLLTDAGCDEVTAASAANLLMKG
ncbi:hypothetical protein B5P43_15730 [Bacillus sp. SRB_336]|nr:hypothetical protein B5P43_15730 [Bacillus sp. SRB_336]